MAIKKEIWDKARLLFEHGKSLNEISDTTGINKSSVSKKSKTEKWVKFNEKSTLVLSEVDTILKQDEINQQKSTLNQQELNFHNSEVHKAISKANMLNMFDNETIKNQEITNKAQKAISDKIEANSDEAIEHLPNIMAISKITEVNRKQLYGNTETYAPGKKEDEETGPQFKLTVAPKKA